MQVIAGLLANFERSKGAKSNSIYFAFSSVMGIYANQKSKMPSPNPYRLPLCLFCKKLKSNMINGLGLGIFDF